MHEMPEMLGPWTSMPSLQEALKELQSTQDTFGHALLMAMPGQHSVSARTLNHVIHLLST